ncbi:hypothetical protein ACIBHX_01530 [Nonomuraea sp. NPDC050536]|uniref:hypothetical protein n=1 Tax=Nonomuraea sp. NPDC050536 TaxID=3364366 RepID=UPI0037C9B6AD
MIHYLLRREPLAYREVGALAYDQTGEFPVIVVNADQQHDAAIASIRSIREAREARQS